MESPYTTLDYTPASDYSYSSSLGTTGGETVVGAMLVVALIVGLISYIIHAILLGMVFKKAGVASWKAWVPVLNSWKMLQIGGQQGFWAILSFIPLVNIAALVFMFIAIHNINRKLGYDTGMTVLALFLTTIWLAIVAFTKNPWHDGAGAPRLDQPEFTPTQAQQPFAAQQQYGHQAPTTQQPYAPQAQAPQQTPSNPQPQTPPQPPVTPGQ